MKFIFSTLLLLVIVSPIFATENILHKKSIVADYRGDTCSFAVFTSPLTFSVEIKTHKNNEITPFDFPALNLPLENGKLFFLTDDYVGNYKAKSQTLFVRLKYEFAPDTFFEMRTDNNLQHIQGVSIYEKRFGFKTNKTSCHVGD